MEGAGLHRHGDDLKEIFLTSIRVRFLIEKQGDKDAVRNMIRSNKKSLMVVMKGGFCYGGNSFEDLKQGGAEQRHVKVWQENCY